VKIVSALAGDLLIRQTSGLFENKVLSLNPTAGTFGLAETGSLTFPNASGSTRGLLSSTDWTTFNNKQNALTNPITGTGVSGQVAYFNGTTTITSESNLFWDATNDRLGIGTDNPSLKLNLKISDATAYTTTSRGNILRLDNDVANGNNNYVGIEFAASGDNITQDVGISGINGVSNGSGLGLLAFYTRNGGGTTWAERMRITSGGNVLIGTTTDAGFKLDVNGTGRFSNDSIINSITVGKGGGSISTNSVFGFEAGFANTTGSGNSFFGYSTGTINTTGEGNSFFGSASGYSNTTANQNTFIGYHTGFQNTTGYANTYLGYTAGRENVSGSLNVAIGTNSGQFIATGFTALTSMNESVFLGVLARANGNNQTNQIVIGSQTTGNGSNTITIGNASITDNYIAGNFNIVNGRNLIIGTGTGTKIGTATTQKISLWNATPIVQPTTAIAESAFVENSGGVNVNDDSTFDGYTLRQVVKALRDVGLLA
jgi:hypothetical protein